MVDYNVDSKLKVRKFDNTKYLDGEAGSIVHCRFICLVRLKFKRDLHCSNLLFGAELLYGQIFKT